MKRLKYIILIAAAMLAVASCLNDDKHRNKYTFPIDNNFEYTNLTFDPVDSVCFQDIFVTGGFIGFYGKMDGDEFKGGICLSRGVDPMLEEGGHTAKTPYHCIMKPESQEDETFAVFHQGSAMPEKIIETVVPNDESTTEPTLVLINNTNGFVQAARYGDGLARGAFTDKDWAAVTFTGYLKGVKTGEASLRLADYETYRDSVITTWTPLELTSLGNIDQIGITLTSTRKDMVKDFCFDHMVFKCYFEY